LHPSGQYTTKKELASNAEFFSIFKAACLRHKAESNPFEFGVSPANQFGEFLRFMCGQTTGLVEFGGEVNEAVVSHLHLTLLADQQ